MPYPRKDYVKRRFGRLLVIAWVGNRNGHQHWLCQCDCGETREVSSGNLLGGQQSCGCLHREGVVSRNWRHGGATQVKRHPLYRTWQTMRKRCNNPNNARWEFYGARGITVCERWSGHDGFANFVADMGTKPSPAHTLDRIDNDGNYEPGNCRWATVTEQNRNRRARRTLAPLLAELEEYRRRYGPLDAGSLHNNAGSQ